MYLIPLYLGLGALLVVAICLLLMPVGKSQLWQHKGKIVSAVGLILLGSLTLYRCWGGYTGLQDLAAFHAIDSFFTPFMQGEKPSKEEVIANLASLETQISYSAAALARLGHFYNELGLNEKALNCFDRARIKSPDNIDYQAQWIYSFSLVNQGNLNDEIRTLAQKILRQQPQQFVLINLLAIDAYLQKDYNLAVSHWQHLLSHDQSLTDERKQVLVNAIQKANFLMSGGPKEEITFQVTVSLSKELVKQVSPTDVVFVYVKSPAVKMPLAVIKKEARDLPFTVELTNQHQMIPGMNMKIGEKVTVVAKISASGDPLAKEGILQGENQNVIISDGIIPIQIEIKQT
ncbi:MAG: tetratricopeptide repeat protein [Candidatus Berkiella sp.]